MTLDELIAYYRQRVRDIDTFAYVQTDQEAAKQLESSRRRLLAKRVLLLEGIGITTTSTPTMSGTLTDELGFLVGTHAAWCFLSDEYHHKVGTGQFGVSWRSGLEEENSLQASKEYRGALDKLDFEWQDWILIINRNTFTQRLQ